MIELKVRSFKIKLRHKVALDSQIVYKKNKQKISLQSFFKRTQDIYHPKSYIK